MRKLLVSLLLLTLLLSMTSTGIAAGKKPNTVKSDIQMLTFVHHAKSGGHSPPTWDDTEDDFRLMMGGAKWSGTISYQVNDAGSGLVEQDVIDTLGASSETWDDETSSELFADPASTEETSIGQDGTNRVVWMPLSAGTIAVTYLWINPRAKEIVEFDMVFNTYYDWGTDVTPDPNKMDLQNIATHELGHNGLSDLKSPKDRELTMYAYSGEEETKKRDLGTGDILGIQRLYGE